MELTGFEENVKNDVERQMGIKGRGGTMTSNYVKRAIRDGSVSEREEGKIRQEKREEIREEQVQETIAKMAMMGAV